MAKEPPCSAAQQSFAAKRFLAFHHPIIIILNLQSFSSLG
jgi:hypothetical protein